MIGFKYHYDRLPPRRSLAEVGWGWRSESTGWLIAVETRELECLISGLKRSVPMIIFAGCTACSSDPVLFASPVVRALDGGGVV